jgi:unsaturated rhamnogalacturonyl hydrolase
MGKWYSHEWHYVNACIMESYIKLYNITHEKKYADFVKSYVNKLFDKNDKPIGFNPKEYNIDQIKMTKVLLDLYQHFPEEKYISTAGDVFNQMKSYPRTKEGNFWHKQCYPNQVWLDGLYMGQPFYTQYLRDFCDKKLFDDSVIQFQICRKRLFNESLSLYMHGYDESKKSFWADKISGRSPSVWLRAIGWFCMALVDVIEIINEDENGTAILAGLFSELAGGLLHYRHKCGMWYQVPDQGARGANYLETSGSAMIAYGLLKACRLGIEPRESALRGIETIKAIMTTYIHEERGEILLGGICRSAGLGIHPELGRRRDGSFRYYTEEEEICENNGHGTSPLFMAYGEYLILKKQKVL